MDKLKQLLANVLNIDTVSFDNNTALLGNIPELDSMAIMTLLVEIEQEYDIAIDSADLSAELFETFGSLLNFVDGQAVA